MSEDKRRDAATAAVGLSGVGGGAAMRHHALVRGYGEKSMNPRPRPKLFAERRFIRHAPGRKTYLTGAGLAFLGAPAAAVGVNGLLNKRNALAEGLAGATDSFQQRTDSMREKPPKKLVAGNYLTSLGIGSGTGGITHAVLSRHPHIGGGTRSALAATGAVVSGAAALPIQAKLTQRASHGKYTATPTGVRRVKTKAVRPSKHAQVIEGRGVPAGEFRRSSVGKAEHDPGANMSRGARRATILGSGIPIPVVGDVMQAGQAARLAPAPYRKRTAAQQLAAMQVGGTAGNIAGAAGAVAIARKSPGFDAGAKRVHGAIEGAKDTVRAKLGIKPSTGPGLATRALDSKRTPHGVRTAVRRVVNSPVGRAIAERPAVAAVGALAGGAIAGNLSSNTMITHQLNRDDAYRATQRGTKVTKLDRARPLSQKDQQKLRRRKNQAAVISTGTGLMGLGALGASLGESFIPNKKVKSALKTAQVPLLTTSAGVGGYGGLNSAAIQRREARSLPPRPAAPAATPPTARRRTATSKALGAPRIRAVRRGFVARRRMPSGLTSTYSVRGGLT